MEAVTDSDGLPVTGVGGRFACDVVIATVGCVITAVDSDQAVGWTMFVVTTGSDFRVSDVSVLSVAGFWDSMVTVVFCYCWTWNCPNCNMAPAWAMSGSDFSRPAEARCARWRRQSEYNTQNN